MKAKPWVWSESIIYCVDLFNSIFIGLPDLKAELCLGCRDAQILDGNPGLRSCFFLTRVGDTVDWTDTQAAITTTHIQRI